MKAVYVIICNDKSSNFEELNSVSIHYRNIQTLVAIEMNKAVNGIFPEIMNEIFQLRILRYTSEFIMPLIHSVYYGSEFASYLGSKI